MTGAGTPAAPAARMQSIDLGRAIAAIAVLTYHVWLYRLDDPDHPSRGSTADSVLFEFRLGLVFFLVLTGYLLYRPFLSAVRRGERVAAWPFLRRRLLRIVPAYYAAVAGSVALLWGIGDAPGVRLPPLDQLPLFLVFAQNYSGATLLKLDPPMWTLAVQAAFYLLLPAIGWILLLAPRRAWLAPAAGLAIGAAWNGAIVAWGGGPVARLALPALLPYFAAGMAVAHLMPGVEARAARGRSVIAAQIALGLAGAGLVVADAVWHALGGGGPVAGVVRDLPAALGFAAMIGALASARGRRTALIPLEALGRWSYGIFLWHVPLIVWLRAHELLPGSPSAAWLLVMAAATVAGALSRYLLERPSLIERPWRAPPSSAR